MTNDTSGKVIARNLFTNPDLAGSGTWSATRKNLMKVPNPSKDVASYFPHGFATLEVGSGYVDVVTTADIPGGTTTTLVRPVGATRSDAIAGNEDVQGGMRLENPNTYPVTLRVGLITGNNSTPAIVSSDFTLNPGERLDVRTPVHLSVEGNTGYRVCLNLASSANTVLPTGTRIRVHDGLTVEIASSSYTPQAATPLHGDQPFGAIDQDMRSRWLGVPNASESVLEIQNVAGVIPAGAIGGVSTWNGKPAIRLIPVGTAGAPRVDIAIPTEAQSGGTVMGTLHLAAPITGGGHTNVRRIGVASFGSTPVSPNAPGSTEHRLEFSALTNTYRVYIYAGGWKGGGDVWWTDIGLFAGSYSGKFFSGSSKTEHPYYVGWEGAPNNSVSFLYYSYSSTPTFWSVDGVSLQTYAYNIQTWGGDAQAPPPLRGDDVTIPYHHGDMWMEKVPDSRTISFGMWVVGANPDGTLPESGSSRAKFEQNWRMLRNLLWTPGRQITLTKRFKNWETGEMIEASAKAQFAGGLTPTMNGTQRAQFVVQLKLADPFFYGEEKSVLVNAYTPEYTNVARNPTPRISAEGYGFVGNGGVVTKTTAFKTPNVTPKSMFVPGVGTVVSAIPVNPSLIPDDKYMVRVEYDTEPLNGEGGAMFGRPNAADIPVTAGEVRRFSMRVIFPTRSNKLRAFVKFYDNNANQVGATVFGASTQVHPPTDTNSTPENAVLPASAWTKITTANITVPAGATRAVLGVVKATDGTNWRIRRVNYVPNPGFEARTTDVEVARNLIKNPQFEGSPTTYSNIPMYINKYPDPDVKLTSGEIELGRNYVGNPSFESGTLAGWNPVWNSSGTTTASVSTTTPYVGTRCALLQSTAAASSRFDTTTSITPVGQVTFSVYLRGTVRTQELVIEERDPRTNAVLTSKSANVSVTGTWTRFSITLENTRATSYNYVGVRFTGGTGTTQLFIDGAQLEAGDTATELLHPDLDDDGFYRFKGDPKTAKSFMAGSRTVKLSDTVKYIRSPRLASNWNPGRLIGQGDGLGMSGYSLTSSLVIERDTDIVTASLGAPIYKIDPSDVGKTLTVVALCYIPPGYNATQDYALGVNEVSRGIYVHTKISWGQAQAPSTPGLHVVRAFITPTEAGGFIRLGGGGMSTSPPESRRVHWGLITIVPGRYLGEPFSGNSTQRSPAVTLSNYRLKVAWSGVVNNSPSIMYPMVPTGVTADSTLGVVPVITRSWGWENGVSLNLVRKGSAADAARGVVVARLDPGMTYYISAVCRIPTGYDASQDINTGTTRSRAISVLSGVTKSLQAPSTVGVHTIGDFFTISGTAPVELRLTGGGLEGQELQWGAISVVKAPLGQGGGRPIVNRPFTGSSVLADMRTRWTGTVNNSESIILAATPGSVIESPDSAYAIRASSWRYRGQYSLRVIATNGFGVSGASFDPSFVPTKVGTYTLKAWVRVPKVMTGGTYVNSLRFHLVGGGKEFLSDPVPNTVGTHPVTWTFTLTSSIKKWDSFIFWVGYVEGEVYIDDLFITDGAYTGAYFDGDSEGSEWMGVPNASASYTIPDVMYANKVGVVEGSSPYDYFSGQGLDTTSPRPSVPYLYGWAAEDYRSTSVMFKPRTSPIQLEVEGDYQTNKINFVVGPNVSSFTIKNQDASGEVSMTYRKGTLDTQSHIDVANYMAKRGTVNTSAWVDNSGSVYWFVLRPGTNSILTSGVGVGNIEMKYRPAWL